MRLFRMQLFWREYLCALISFFSLKVLAQNDNSQFVLAVGTSEIVKPVGCHAKFWLSTGQQTKSPTNTLEDSEWWWEHPVGTRIEKSDTNYPNGLQRDNPWDLEPTITYSAVHYYLEVNDIQDQDFGVYRFVVKLPNGTLENGMTRYEDLNLIRAKQDVYCSHPVSFGVRKEYLQLLGASVWTFRPSDKFKDHIFMVGPFVSPSGNPKERYQITGFDINARYHEVENKCKRFGYNFKIQIFNVENNMATVERQEEIVVAMDALLDKFRTFYSSLRKYYPFPNPNNENSKKFVDWTHLDIPVWYSKGPLLIREGQYVGISTEGCIELKSGTKNAFTNIPGQKAYYFQSDILGWDFRDSEGNPTKFFTAKPALVGEEFGPLIEKGGPWSFGFDAEFYDIETKRVIPPPPQESSSSPLLALWILLIILFVLCFCCCILCIKTEKKKQERRNFARNMLLKGNCNKSSLTGTFLPPGWFEEKTEDGDIYFYNPQTKESMWDIPCFSLV